MDYQEGLVSVVVPTYKRLEKLPRAIESILSQTYKDIELFVVNDNEPEDKYTQYVKLITNRYASDPRFHLIIQDRHINGAVARNIAIRQACGEFIAFLDDDDWWEPNKIEEQLKVLFTLDESWGGVSCKFRFYNEKGNVVGQTYKYNDGMIYKDIIYMYTEVATGTLLLKRKALDESGYFDETLLRSQDIQLLTNFTFKYKLKEVDQYLHCADCSDSQNRLFDEEQYLSVLKAYLKSIEPIFNTLAKSEKKCALHMRYFTLGFILIRNKKFFRGIRYLLPMLTNPLSIYMAMKIVMRKMKEKR